MFLLFLLFADLQVFRARVFRRIFNPVRRAPEIRRTGLVCRKLFSVNRIILNCITAHCASEIGSSRNAFCFSVNSFLVNKIIFKSVPCTVYLGSGEPENGQTRKKQQEEIKLSVHCLSDFLTSSLSTLSLIPVSFSIIYNAISTPLNSINCNIG